MDEDLEGLVSHVSLGTNNFDRAVVFTTLCWQHSA